MGAIFSNLQLITILLNLLSLHFTDVSTESPSPSPSPLSSAPPPSPFPSPNSSPSPSPYNSPAADDEIPAPAPVKEGEGGLKVKEEDVKGEEEREGMSGGKKAGIAIGVIAAVCLVGVGGFVYKKRKENVRRSEYGYRGILMEAFSGKD